METNIKSRKKSIRDFFTLSYNLDYPGEFRIIKKNGETTLKLLKLPSSRKWFYPNMFVSMVMLDSMWICLIFLTCITLSWSVFTVLYLLISEGHGDFSRNSDTASALTPCVEGVSSLLEMFMFSMETQTTIGYGTHYITEQCPASIFVMIVQSILGSLILPVITGIILFKFQEPKRRAHTVLFSKVACVYRKEGKYYIEIQILNMQHSQVINPNVTALCIMNNQDRSGKCRFDMHFTAHHEHSRLFFRPRIYRHLIDSRSPFWEFNRKYFEKGVYEIVITIDGLDEFTDSFVQARTSYLPSEIKWSRNFKQMTATRIGDMFKLNFNDFRKLKRTFNMTDDSASEISQRTSDTSENFLNADK